MRQTPCMRVFGLRWIVLACAAGLLGTMPAPAPAAERGREGGPPRAPGPAAAPDPAANPRPDPGADRDEGEGGAEEADPYTGSLDEEASERCRPAGSIMTEDGRFLITTVTNLWEVAANEDRWTVSRRIERNGVPDIIREGTANVEWRRWEASEETRCLCTPPRAEQESPCECSIQNTSSAHTVTVVGTDTTYPESDWTRKAGGSLRVLPDGRLSLRIGERPCILRKL